MSRKLSTRAFRYPMLRPAAAFYACELLEPRTLLTLFPIDAPNGNNLITLSTHTRLGIQSFVDYSINNGPTQSIRVLPTDSIFLDTGTGTDEVIVLSTVPGVPTFIQGRSMGDDVLNVGGPNGMQGIAGSITIHNTTGFWDIMADDSGNTTSARTSTLSGNSLTGLAPGNITWDANVCHGLLINTSSNGGNSFNVLETLVSTTIQGHSSGSDDSVTIGNPNHGLADIFSPVTIDQSAQSTGKTSLTLDDQANPAYERYILDNGSLSVGGNVSFANYTSNIAWMSAGVRSVTLKSEAQVPGQGPSGVYVVNTNVPTTIVGDTSGFSVMAGQAVVGHTLQGILGNIYVTNPAGSTQLGVVGPNGNAAQVVLLHTVTLPGDAAPYGAIEGLWPASIAFRYADTANAGFGATGNAADTIDVTATATNVTVNAPKVNVGDAASLQNIAGTLSIFAGSVTVDDSADPISRNATLTVQPETNDGWVTIGGLSPANIRAFPLTSNVVINGGTGANTYLVNAPPMMPGGTLAPNTAVVLNTGSGNDTVQVVATWFGKPLAINGQGGNDAFSVSYSPSVTNNLNFNGGTGSSTLTLIGTGAGAQFGLTSGTITFTPPASATLTTTYAAIKTLALSTGIFTITDDLGGVNLSTSGFTTAKFQASAHLGMLNIGGGSQVMLAPGAMPLATTLSCTGLSIDPTGKLDLTNNSLQLSYAGPDPVATVHSYLSSGYNGGAWNGSGIDSSSADAAHTLGFADAADGIVSGLPANTILVRFAREGDVNLDGTVGFSDLLLLAQHYGNSTAGWSQGDMNYDNTVGFADLLILAQNYGQTVATIAAAAASVNSTDFLPRKAARKR